MTSFWSPGTTQSSPSSSECNPRRPNTSRIIRRSSAAQLSIRSSPPVTPARAMNEAISMWSGLTVCSQPCSLPMPWTCMTFEPIPSTAQPILLSMRARSCTCGSQAALRITVVPSISADAISAFSVPITDGSSMKKSHACSPPLSATMRMSLPCSTVAPRARNASRCGSSRRRPITSPPGGGIVAAPKRASSGPAARNEARMRSASAESTAVLCTLAAHSTTVLWSGRSISTPRSSSRSSRASVSRIRGTLCSVTRSSVSSAQASNGSAAFLLPAGTTVPESGTPPSITNFSIRAAARLPTHMSVPMTRDEAWTLFCEWTASESLRRHVLAVEACMRAYAEKFGEDPERWGMVGMLHDLDYERYPDLHTGHPRYALAELEPLGFPQDMVRAVASHADYLEVSRDTPMEKTLFAVDELSGFVMACAYVRPQGIHGLTPKSVKKKMKSPAFAAAVDRDAMREGAEGLGVDFDEHVTFVVAALEPEAEVLGLDGNEDA